jgi:hypothetical protein
MDKQNNTTAGKTIAFAVLHALTIHIDNAPIGTHATPAKGHPSKTPTTHHMHALSIALDSITNVSSTTTSSPSSSSSSETFSFFFFFFTSSFAMHSPNSSRVARKFAYSIELATARVTHIMAKLFGNIAVDETYAPVAKLSTKSTVAPIFGSIFKHSSTRKQSPRALNIANSTRIA